MSNSKWSAEFRAKVSQEYLDGKGSYDRLASMYHIGATTIKKCGGCWFFVLAACHSKGSSSYDQEGGLYSAFHFWNHFSLKVMPMQRRR